MSKEISMATFETLSTGSVSVNVDPDDKMAAAFISHYPKLADFEGKFRLPEEDHSIKDRALKLLKGQVKNCDPKAAIQGYFPIIHTLRTYKLKEYLPNDAVAGITAGVMMIPQGMAFAALSTLPHIVGLYISLFASLTYFFLGTGRQLSWGCIAILSLMMASILDKYDNSEASSDFIEGLLKSEDSKSAKTDTSNNSYSFQNHTGDLADSLLNNGTLEYSEAIQEAIMDRRIEVASGVSVIVGLILIVASRIGLSRITNIMSNSLITGFTVGISFHVATSQLKGIFGLSVPRYKGIGQLIRTWITVLKELPNTNVSVLVISVICMLVIYLVKRFINEKYKKKMKVPIPIELFVVIVATLLSHYIDFHEKFDVKIVKEVPIGVPAPKLPDVSLVSAYIGDALVIIVVSFAQSLAMAKTMGLKHNYVIDSNQEMMANGACTIVCGFFSGYITGASVSRSVVQDGAGGKTQVASLFAALMVLLVIMVLGPYFYSLPTCVLSAIILINLRSMFLKLLLIPKEWRKSNVDCLIWVFTCIATIILNADVGLLASVMFSLFLVIFRSMVHPVEEVGQIETSTLTIQLRSVAHYASVKTLHSVTVIRVKTPLYFFNSDTFTNAVFEKVKINPLKIKAFNKEKHESETKNTKKHSNEESLGNGMVSAEKSEKASLLQLKVLIIDVSEVAFVDIMGIQALEFIINEYTSIGIEVLIISIPENIFGILKSSGFWKKQSDRLFINVESALASIAAAIENQDGKELAKG